MKQVKVADLKHWEDNPRDITEDKFKLLLRQLRYGEIENLIMLKDGTVLNGNRRLDAYNIVGKTTATVAVVEFERQPSGKFHMKTDGVLCTHLYPEELAGQTVEFDSEYQGMVEVMGVSNSHVGQYIDVKLAEMLTEIKVEPQLFEVNLKRGVMAEDLVAAFGPNLPTGQDEEPPLEPKNPVRELRFFLQEGDYDFIRLATKRAKKELGMENPNEIVLEAFIALADRMDGINYNG